MKVFVATITGVTIRNLKLQKSYLMMWSQNI